MLPRATGIDTGILGEHAEHFHTYQEDCITRGTPSHPRPIQIHQHVSSVAPKYEGHAALLLSHVMSLDPYTEYDDNCGERVTGIPQDAHVIRYRGLVSTLHVPLLCVADEGNIVPLITSTLYQRHVLSLREPVVGLMIAPFGWVVDVLIGWLSDLSGEQKLVMSHFIHERCIPAHRMQ